MECDSGVSVRAETAAPLTWQTGDVTLVRAPLGGRIGVVDIEDDVVSQVNCN